MHMMDEYLAREIFDVRILLEQSLIHITAIILDQKKWIEMSYMMHIHRSRRGTL